MKKILTGALAALTVGGALAASTVPASAAPHYRGGYHGGYHGPVYRGGYHGGYYRGGWGGGAGAAIIGLGIGAALAGAYAAPPAYYYGPPCRLEWRWNPYWGGYDRVRVCY